MYMAPLLPKDLVVIYTNLRVTDNYGQQPAILYFTLIIDSYVWDLLSLMVSGESFCNRIEM